MKILVTGGAGYIGSHTTLLLLEGGYDVVVVDNLCNSKYESLRRVQEYTGKTLTFYEQDLCDEKAVDEIFAKEGFDAVIHFAGLKAVGESVAMPIEYYRNNLISTLNLLASMKKYGVKNLVFSSSATVYGTPKTVPIREDFPLSTTNPYGATKLMIEDILRDAGKADKDLNVALLRYFNPIGAHKSGLIGEDPKGIPNNLLPYVAQVAIGKLPCLSVFGNDYNTVDGTGVRDYIHVVDLARGHIAAINKLQENPGVVVYNLGTGNGYSVLQVVDAFEKASGKKVNYKIVPRRPGDVAECYADPAKARDELHWQAEFGIEEMCRDSWNWQSKNPNGFDC